jgi:hypothetical protein
VFTVDVTVPLPVFETPNVQFGPGARSTQIVSLSVTLGPVLLMGVDGFVAANAGTAVTSVASEAPVRRAIRRCVVVLMYSPV